MSQEIEMRVENQPTVGDMTALLRDAERMRAELALNALRWLLRRPLRPVRSRVHLARPENAAAVLPRDEEPAEPPFAATGLLWGRRSGGVRSA